MKQNPHGGQASKAYGAPWAWPETSGKIDLPATRHASIRITCLALAGSFLDDRTSPAFPSSSEAGGGDHLLVMEKTQS
jgi:hypothetical protein